MCCPLKKSWAVFLWKTVLDSRLNCEFFTFPKGGWQVSVLQRSFQPGKLRFPHGSKTRKSVQSPCPFCPHSTKSRGRDHIQWNSQVFAALIFGPTCHSAELASISAAPSCGPTLNLRSPSNQKGSLGGLGRVCSYPSRSLGRARQRPHGFRPPPGPHCRMSAPFRPKKPLK